jgi:hypothetical protein
MFLVSWFRVCWFLVCWFQASRFLVRWFLVREFQVGWFLVREFHVGWFLVDRFWSIGFWSIGFWFGWFLVRPRRARLTPGPSAFPGIRSRSHNPPPKLLSRRFGVAGRSGQ